MDKQRQEQLHKKRTNPKKAKSHPHVVFVGQLSSKTTANDIKELFLGRGGIQGDVAVRLLTHPAAGGNPPRSKGMAFVEVCDAEQMFKCLALHHTRLHGRLLNVELSAGGGASKKTKKVKDFREEQVGVVKGTVDRIVKEWVGKGKLVEGELDEDCFRILARFEGKVIEKALEEYCTKEDKATLRNRSAYFVHTVHKLGFNEDVLAFTSDIGSKAKEAGKGKGRVGGAAEPVQVETLNAKERRKAKRAAAFSAEGDTGVESRPPPEEEKGKAVMNAKERRKAMRAAAAAAAVDGRTGEGGAGGGVGEAPTRDAASEKKRPREESSVPLEQESQNGGKRQPPPPPSQMNAKERRMAKRAAAAALGNNSSDGGPELAPNSKNPLSRPTQELLGACVKGEGGMVATAKARRLAKRAAARAGAAAVEVS